MKKYILSLAALMISVIVVTAQTSNLNDEVNFTPKLYNTNNSGLTLLGTPYFIRTIGINSNLLNVYTSPSGLTATSITNVLAKLSWNATSGALSYNIQYRTKGASSWNTKVASSIPCILTELYPLTTYECKVQAVYSLGSSSFSSSYFFTTTVSDVNCGTPSNITLSSLTDVSAIFDWTSISGVANYSLEYRVINDSAWIIANTNTNSIIITGLSETTRYEYRLQSVCTTGTSSFSDIGTFTTASSDLCADIYEPNNTLATAAAIPVNTTINATLSTGSDVDIYEVTNNVDNASMVVILYNLPEDYDLRLYKSDGTLISSSINTGTTDEQIVYSSAAAGTYYVKVFSSGGFFTSANCYSLFVKMSGNQSRLSHIGNETSTKFSTSLSPNPANNKATLSYSIDEDKIITVKLYDITGRMINSNEYASSTGLNNKTLDLNNVKKGLYIVELNDGSNVTTQKLVVDK